MSKLQWHKPGEKIYEMGVSKGVLFPQVALGYADGVAWNGLTGVTEKPSGAEATPSYADNVKYASIVSAEQFAATIEAFTYPPEFAACDGTATVRPGVTIGQQRRVPFAFSYRTEMGNDTEGEGFGYNIHLIWGAQAAPSEKARKTINENPELSTFNWSLSTTPVSLTEGDYKPTAYMKIDSTKVNPTNLKALEDILYGTEANEAKMPTPDEVVALFPETP